MFEASVHIHVGLGQAPCLQKTQPRPHHHVTRPSCVRRRARREEAAQVEAEHVANNERRLVEKKTAENAAIFDEVGNATVMML